MWEHACVACMGVFMCVHVSVCVPLCLLICMRVCVHACECITIPSCVGVHMSVCGTIFCLCERVCFFLWVSLRVFVCI